MRKLFENKNAVGMIVLLVCAGLVFCPAGTWAIGEEADRREPTAERSAEAMVFDLAFIRIFGLAGCVLGTTAFVLSWPFSAMGGNTDEAYERLMADPARYTFKRPLGDF